MKPGKGAVGGGAGVGRFGVSPGLLASSWGVLVHTARCENAQHCAMMQPGGSSTLLI